MMQQERPISYHKVTLGEMTREGDTLAEISEENETGEQAVRTLHVPAGLPGEQVTIAVEAPPLPPQGKRHRRRWKPRLPRVEIIEMHQASPLRTAVPCPVFGMCGGCQLQHMQYAAQLEWKWSIVRQLLRDTGGFDNPPLLETVPCDEPCTAAKILPHRPRADQPRYWRTQPGVQYTTTGADPLWRCQRPCAHAAISCPRDRRAAHRGRPRYT